MRNVSTQIDQHLKRCLPPGVPSSYSRIIRAWVRTPGKQKVLEAELVMFDGEVGRVEVFKAGQHGDIEFWGHRWTSLPGGSISYETGGWVRCDEAGIVIPLQGSLVFDQPQTTKRSSSP